METDPLLGASSPAHNPSKVVLPLPDGPIIAAVEPDSMLNVTSFRTVSSELPDR
jgi:hypothetical protein